MNHSIRTLLYISIFGLLVTGCSPSSNSSSNKPAVVNKINGYVGASNIFKSTVFAAPVDVQGQPGFGEDEQGNPIGDRAISNTRAYYQLSLTEQESARPVVFIANAQPNGETTQRCELVDGCENGTSGTPYANDYPLLGNDAPAEAERFRLNAAVGSVGNNSRVNINWITHLAADIAYTTYVDEEGVSGPLPTNDPQKQKPVDGMFTPYTIERGNIWIKKQFRLGDIISVRPIAPSALNESSELADGLREQGIRYGALLAAGQQLAKDKGITDVAWVSSVVNQQRDLHGQLFLKAINTEFSMCKLYGAAESVLASNLEQQKTLSAAVQIAAQEQQVKFKKEKEFACSADMHAQTDVEVDITEIEGWVDSFKQAKDFIDDLNKRILNMRCDKGREGFFDCGYVDETKQYYDDLEQFYHDNKPELVGALKEIRDDIVYFIACLNDANDANDASCTATTYVKDNLTYTLKPVESTKVEVDGVDKYYAFDFRISGTKAIGDNSDVEKDILITFNKTEKEEDDRKDTDYNFIRVVYQGDAFPYEIPAELAFANDNPPTDGVEPLGFNINLVSISIENKDFKATYPKLKDFNLYFTAKLFGVKPLESQKAMHYNLTEVAVGLNIQGDLLETIVEEGEDIKLKDTAEMTFSILFSDAANFYAKSLWPDSDDYFTAESGVDATEKASFGNQLFKYLLMEDQEVLISASTSESGELINPIRQKADYLEFEVKGLGVNRFEKYKQDEQHMLRKCLISATIDDDLGKKDENKQCIQAQAVAADFDLVEDLITKIGRASCRERV